MAASSRTSLCAHVPPDPSHEQAAADAQRPNTGSGSLFRVKGEKEKKRTRLAGALRRGRER
jgi:hypothetical protein